MGRVSLAVAFFLSATTTAAASQVVYNFTLLEQGLPAVDGEYLVEYELSDSPGGGPNLGFESAHTVSVSGGKFADDIGSLLVMSAQAAYLTIRVTPPDTFQVDVLSPIQIFATAYAVQANNAQHAAVADQVDWSGVTNAPAGSLVVRDTMGGVLGKVLGQSIYLSPENRVLTTFQTSDGLIWTFDEVSFQYPYKSARFFQSADCSGVAMLLTRSPQTVFQGLSPGPTGVLATYGARLQPASFYDVTNGNACTPIAGQFFGYNVQPVTPPIVLGDLVIE